MVRNKRIAVAVVTMSLLLSMSTSAFAAAGDYTSISPDSGGSGPSLVHQTEDGYSSLTVYDGVTEIDTPMYTGEVTNQIRMPSYTAPKHYPFEITNVSEGNYTLVVKTYEVSVGTDPQELIESNIVRNGSRYVPRDILEKKLDGDKDSKEATTSVTVSVDSKDLVKAIETIKAREGESKQYGDGSGDGYSGSLVLDPASVQVVQAGTTSYSIPITETREYAGLEIQDPSLVSKTITKDGVTLTLAGVDFVPMGSSVSGDSIVQNYKAVATYTGTGYGSKATGYTATATYRGMVTKEVAGDYLYSVVYAPYEATLTAEELEAYLNPPPTPEEAAAAEAEKKSFEWPKLPGAPMSDLPVAAQAGVIVALLGLLAGLGLWLRSRAKKESEPEFDSETTFSLSSSDLYAPAANNNDSDDDDALAVAGDEDNENAPRFYSLEGEVVDEGPEDKIVVLTAKAPELHDDEELWDGDENDDEGSEYSSQSYPEDLDDGESGDEVDVSAVDIYGADADVDVDIDSVKIPMTPEEEYDFIFSGINGENDDIVDEEDNQNV